MTPYDPQQQRVQKLALAFIARTGMAPADFATRVGYGYKSIHLFLIGKYERIKDQGLVNAVLTFLESNPLEAADGFTGNIYETGAVTAMRDIFKRLLERPRLFLAYAPPGSGKTDIARHLITEDTAAHGAPRVFRIYCRARISPRDLIRRICYACGTTMHSSIERSIANLRYDFRGQRVALYLDEAQHLSMDCFETVRELLDESPRFSLCFAGSHELEKVFDDFAETLEQLERRVTDKVHLPALTRDEAAGILRQELVEVAPHLEAAVIQEQIDLASITVRINKKRERYISIGRLMAAARDARETLATNAPATDLSGEWEAVQ
jgi:DNA transposition AAA+ family ATPase